MKALTKDDVETCVSAARVAQEEWAKTSLAERSAGRLIHWHTSILQYTYIQCSHV